MSQPFRVINATIAPGPAMAELVAVAGGWPWENVPNFARLFWTIFFQGIYLIAIVLVFCAYELYHWCIMGLVTYCGWATFLGFLRTGIRQKYQIPRGDLTTDLVCAWFMPMFVITQLEIQVEFEKEKAAGKGKNIKSL